MASEYLKRLAQRSRERREEDENVVRSVTRVSKKSAPKPAAPAPSITRQYQTIQSENERQLTDRERENNRLYSAYESEIGDRLSKAAVKNPLVASEIFRADERQRKESAQRMGETAAVTSYLRSEQSKIPYTQVSDAGKLVKTGDTVKVIRPGEENLYQGDAPALGGPVESGSETVRKRYARAVSPVAGSTDYNSDAESLWEKYGADAPEIVKRQIEDIEAITAENPGAIQTGELYRSVQASLTERRETLAELQKMARDAALFEKYGSVPEREDFAQYGGYPAASYPEFGGRADEILGGDELIRPEAAESAAYDDKVLKNRDFYAGLSEEDRTMYRLISHEIGSDEATGYALMDEEERGIFRYLYNRDGADAAREYYENLSEELTKRQGQREKSAVEAIENPLVRKTQELAGAYGAGLSDFGTAVHQTFSRSDAVPLSAVQYQAAATAAEKTGFGRVLYDATRAVGGMTPALAAGAIAGAAGLPAGTAKWIGQSVMGLNAYGNSYRSALESGHGEGEATAYALLSAASELATEKALSGISALGGALPDTVKAKLGQNVGSAALRFALNMGVSMGSEGFEEVLQNEIDLLLRNSILGEENDLNLFTEENLYTFLSSAFSAGVLELPGTAFQTQRVTPGADAGAAIDRSYDAIARTGLWSPTSTGSMAEAAGMARAQVAQYNENAANASARRLAKAGDVSFRPLPVFKDGKVVEPDQPALPKGVRIVENETVESGSGTVHDIPKGAAGTLPNGVKAYTPEQAQQKNKVRDTYMSFVISGKQGLKDFWNRITGRDNKGAKKETAYLGLVTPEMGKVYEQVIGQDLTNYSYSVDSDMISHVQKEHGVDGRRRGIGEVPVNEDGFGELLDILQHPDEIYDGGVDEAGHRVVITVRRSGGTTAYIQWVQENNKGVKRLNGKTFFMSSEDVVPTWENVEHTAISWVKNEQKKKTPDRLNGAQSTPPPYVQNVTGPSSLDTNIPQSEAGVNTQSMQGAGEISANTSDGAARGKVLYPIFDKDGKVINGYGETVDMENQREYTNAEFARSREAGEFDADGNPVYFKTRKEANVQAENFVDQKRRRKEADITYSITPNEGLSLARYIQGMSGVTNRKMSSGTLSEGDQRFANRIIAALKKFPVFNGTVYRNLGWTSESEYKNFLSEHAVGNEVTLKAFTSTSKRPNGYVVEKPYVAHMVIQAKNGADIADTYGFLRQQEVVLLPSSKIAITSVGTASDGNPLIYAREVSANELGRDYGDQKSERGVSGNREESLGGRTVARGDGEPDRGVSEQARDRYRNDDDLPRRGEHHAERNAGGEQPLDEVNRGIQIEEVPTNNEGSGETPAAFSSARDAEDSTGAFGEDSVGAARPLSTEEKAQLYDNYVREHGAIPKGENPVRNVDVPRKTGKNRHTRQGARTFIESAHTPEAMVQELKAAVADDLFAYERSGNKEMQNQADATLHNEGFDGALEKWDAVYERGIAKPGELVLGETLYIEAARRGEKQLAIELAAEVSELATEAGRSVQVMRIMSKATPEGKLYSLENSVRKINGRLKERYKRKFKRGKMKEVSISDELKEKLLGAETREEADAAVDLIERNIAEQLPSTLWDRVDAIRYFMMLSNPKTHIRNFLGNTIFGELVDMKDMTGVALEHLLRVRPEERTKAILTKKDRELRAFAAKDFDKNIDEISGKGKYSYRGRIEEKKKVFKHETLNKITGAPGNLLEWADEKALRPRYAKALAGFLKARGITAETIGTEKGKKALAAGRQYAITEAQKATFRDASEFARNISNFERKNAVTRLIVGGNLPFTKTPINVLKRGVEYSPVGLVKGTADLLTKVKEGRMSASQAIDEISAGTVGTGLAILGYCLGSMGIVSLGGSDDEKEHGFESLQGKQNYALNIGGHSYTIDWLSPAAMPFFIGAELQNVLETRADIRPKEAVNAISRLFDPVMEMSFMQGVENTALTLAYGDYGGPIQNFVAATLENYGSQFTPSVGGAIARTVDPVRRSYYPEEDNPLPNSFQKMLQKNVAKIPYFSQTLEPYVDQWGREEVNDSVFGRLVENFVSPGYYSKETVTEVDEEIERLYAQTGEKPVLPAYAPDDATQDNKKYNMTAKEHTQYAKTKGQTAFRTIEALLDTPDYRAADDAEKVKFIRDVYDYSGQVAKKELLAGRKVVFEPDRWVSEAHAKAGNQKGGRQVAQAIAFRRTLAEVDLTVESYDKVRTAQRKMGISYQDYVDVYADVAAARKKYEDSDEKPDKIREAIYGSTKLNADQKAYMSFLFVRGDVEDADALKTLGGISYSVYEDYLNEASKITAKDENGNTVNGLAKRRKERYIDSLPINDSQKELLKATISTSKASRSYLKYRIEVAPLTREQKSELWEHFLGD